MDLVLKNNVFRVKRKDSPTNNDHCTSSVCKKRLQNEQNNNRRHLEDKWRDYQSEKKRQLESMNQMLETKLTESHEEKARMENLISQLTRQCQDYKLKADLSCTKARSQLQARRQTNMQLQAVIDPFSCHVCTEKTITPIPCMFCTYNACATCWIEVTKKKGGDLVKYEWQKDNHGFWIIQPLVTCPSCSQVQNQFFEPNQPTPLTLFFASWMDTAVFPLFSSSEPKPSHGYRSRWTQQQCVIANELRKWADVQYPSSSQQDSCPQCSSSRVFSAKDLACHLREHNRLHLLLQYLQQESPASQG